MAVTTIGNEHLSVTISPLGAELQTITGSDGAEWLWDGDPAFWNGRAPVLFPIVGKAPHDHISIDGQRYPMGQHGFARRSEFSLVQSSATECRFELASGQASHSIYPYEFLLALSYAVEGKSLSVTAEVSNRDHRPMPFQLGFHPAFVWPLPGCAGEVHSVTLENDGEPVLIRLEGGLVRPQTHASPFEDGALVLEPALFDADAMLFPEGAGAGLRYAAGEKGLRFTWENLPNFAIWSKPGASFVCLEPWRGTAAEVGGSDALEDRPYGEVLGPGATARYGYKVTLD